MTAIKYTVDVQVSGGPRVNFTNILDADAYGRIDAVIPTGGAATDVVILPADSAAQFLLIKSSDASDDVTFDNGGTDVGLKSPLLLAGSALSATPALDKLTFKNGTAADVTVTIIFGSDNTP